MKANLWLLADDGCFIRRCNRKRPQQVLALLHGPPGSGKTTVVRSLAKQAGYRILEVNASDDRTVEAINRHLESLSFKAVLSRNNKPTLVLLDEIDGAPEPTIRFICGLAQKRKIAGPVIAVANFIHGQPGFDQLRKWSRGDILEFWIYLKDFPRVVEYSPFLKAIQID